MWRDICLANRDALLGELRRYQDALAARSAQRSSSRDGAALAARVRGGARARGARGWRGDDESAR